MHYRESALIKDGLTGAKNILINCHTHPDADSVAGALALSGILQGLGKKTTIICPDSVPRNLRFLNGWENIAETDFSGFDFTRYDLFFILDTSNWKRVTGKSDSPVPEIKKIIIDHHRDNELSGKINLVDADAGSASEILYRLAADLNFKLNPEIGGAILAGMAGDSSGFWNSGAGYPAFRIISELMEIGVNKTEIITNLYGSMTPASLGLLGEVLKGINIDPRHNFIWSSVPYGTYIRYSDSSALDVYSGIFLRSVQETGFGMLFLEKTRGEIEFSIKSRNDCDVSRIAKALGGGGHKRAGGGIVPCDDFAAKVGELLDIARGLTG